MNIAVTIVAVILVIAGVAFSWFSKKEIQTSETSQVLSVEEESEAPSDGVKEESTPTIGSQQLDKPSSDQSLSETEATNTPKPSQNNVSSLQYPNSQTVSSGDNSLILNSTDNVDTITDWYKEKIKGEGMNVTSFVTTKTNDNVLNKLVGADGEREIRVEITKQAGSSNVKISIVITAD